ncbi:MAG: helix-turn-helix domain-containing protein [Mucilaginibacter sp.]
MGRTTYRADGPRFFGSLVSIVDLFNPLNLFVNSGVYQLSFSSTSGDVLSKKHVLAATGISSGSRGINCAWNENGDINSANTLRYIDDEIEKIMKSLGSVKFNHEPGMPWSVIAQVISGLVRIKSAIALPSAGRGTAEGIGSNNQLRSHSTNENDDAFFRQLKAAILQNLTNTDLDIRGLCNLMNMSRRNLFRRIKLATGLSPGELVNEIRLRTARELMVSSDLKMYEIAELVGFRSRIVFTRNFTRLYGISPTEFLKMIKRKY